MVIVASSRRTDATRERRIRISATPSSQWRTDAGRRSSARASCTRVGVRRGDCDGFAPEGSVFSVSNGSSFRSVPTARQGTGSWISHQEGNGLRVFEQGPGVALVTARSEDILDSRALALLPRVLLLARRG